MSAGGIEQRMVGEVGWPFPRAALRRMPPIDSPRDLAPPGRMVLDGTPWLFHSGSVTAYSERLQALAPTIAARLHPEDAARLDIEAGDIVSVASAANELLLRARLDRSIRRGSVSVAWNAGRDGASVLADGGTPVDVAVRRVT